MAFITRAGLIDRVSIRVGAALDTLDTMADAGPFDLIFIDADKQNNPGYFEWALRLSRPGSLIIVDNVVRDGAVIDAASDGSACAGGTAVCRTGLTRTTGGCHRVADSRQQGL